MALSDYGFVNNDIVINTPIEKVITGFLLAVNKVYRSIYRNDNGNISTFLSSVSIRHFIINNSSYDYLRLAEDVMFYEGYSNINNVYRRFCYLNETTGEFILFNKNNDNARLLERNTILQDAVAQLIDSGFQTSILPFYYYNNGYLTAVEFESFYRVFAYPFFKDYFIQRLKYLSLLRVYTEYRAYDLHSNHLIYERSDEGGSSDNDIFIAYNNLVFKHVMYHGGNRYFLNVEIYRFNSNPNDIHFYITHVIKNVYIPKRIYDNFISSYDDRMVYNKCGVWQFSSDNLMGENGVLVNPVWQKLDTSTVYSITYSDDGNEITEDCYKVDYNFDIENFIIEQLNRLNELDTDDVQDISRTYYCEWFVYDTNNYMTTISDCFDFSDI